MSSKQTQETTKTIRDATGNEALLNNLFTQIAQQAGAGLDDFEGLGAGPTAADRDLVEQSIGASSDIARRELERSMKQIMAQLSEELAARGIQGSSIESMMAGQVGSQGFQSIANLLSQKQAEGGQALMNLPFQRANVELGKNQALLQRLTSLGGAIQQGGLAERLNTISSKTTQTQQPGAMQLAQMGMAFANPMAALGNAALGAFGGGGGQAGAAPLWYQGGQGQGPSPNPADYGIPPYNGPFAS